MSRSVRIRGDVAARIEALADAERRPFANAVEVLLLAALTERGVPAPSPSAGTPVREGVADLPRSVTAAVPSVAHDVPMRAHMRLDRRAIECKNRVAAGEVCQVCGAEGR